MRYGLWVALVVVLLGALAGFYFGFHQKGQLAAPATAPQSPKDIHFKVIDAGTSVPSEPTRKNYAIYEQSAFTDFWKETHGGATTGMPIVDFSKNYVVGVFAGNEPSGGYGITVSSITDDGQKRVVTVTISKPGDNCSVVEEQTSPYQFVVVPFTSSMTVTHADTTVTSDCGS